MTAAVMVGFAVFFCLWAAFNWLAPLALLAECDRIGLGRIPAGILERAGAHHVRFFTSDLKGRGYAFATWLGFMHAVVLDREFMRQARPIQIHFVLAHELGHCALGHLRLRWAATVTGLALVPAVKAWLSKKEEEADAWAEQLSGVPRIVLHDPLAAEVIERVR